jgi:demethylmenaquinone methyltransferase/2-methoxy-6-polyprenyl-1,4-benzoquinol methylase
VTPPLGEWPFDQRGPEHSQRVYDWWGRHDWAYRAFVNGYLLGREATFRTRTVDALGLESGERVLDVGCGPGLNFERLAADVGPTGTVVGVDASEGMVERATSRSATLDCSADVLRADAARLPVRDGAVDAVCATLSLSAMPDVEAVVDQLSRALRSGGRLAVLDARPFQAAYGRWLNPVIERAAAYLTNWYPDADIVGAVDDRFAETTLETFQGGTIYVLTGRNETDRYSSSGRASSSSS